MFMLKKNTIKSLLSLYIKRIRRILPGILALGILWSAFLSIPSVYAMDEPDHQTEIAEPDHLYAASAVLMDAKSGRLLFEKNGHDPLAMASTTKIMTCILALEYGNMDDIVTASANAAAQPEVRLGVSEGRQFLLRDLLYSLMLESHNDSAVMIAEHIGGTVEGFADMMNAKAAEIGCEDTYFITSNGLDAEDENGFHHTTAADLAAIMKYCIQDSPKHGEFLAVTRTQNYQFSDCSNVYTYSCVNHNAFLQMMEGALSGKTGFTSKAGYCYVGALERDGKRLIVALLACGWPNHKGYKWSDTRILMQYGLDEFDYEDVWQDISLAPVYVTDGIPDGGKLSGRSTAELTLTAGIPLEEELSEPSGTSDSGLSVLLRHDQQVRVETELPEGLCAPVAKGEKVGAIRYLLDGEVLREYKIVTAEAVDARTFQWCMKETVRWFLL